MDINRATHEIYYDTISELRFIGTDCYRLTR